MSFSVSASSHRPAAADPPWMKPRSCSPSSWPAKHAPAKAGGRPSTSCDARPMEDVDGGGKPRHDDGARPRFSVCNANPGTSPGACAQSPSLYVPIWSVSRSAHNDSKGGIRCLSRQAGTRHRHWPKPHKGPNPNERIIWRTERDLLLSSPRKRGPRPELGPRFLGDDNRARSVTVNRRTCFVAGSKRGALPRLLHRYWSSLRAHFVSAPAPERGAGC
jgi:hypothetical protein